MEEELESSEKKLAEMSARLADAEKQADESERARRVLEDRGQSEDDRLTRLNMELDDVLAKNDEVELRYKQVSKQLRSWGSN